MQLEVLARKSRTANERPPIILVHGAWHAAWCWEENFLVYFPSQGWDTYAISLRGHGRSDGKKQLRWASISDYVSDLRCFVTDLDQPPFLVGHSMGGFVVQKYLENERAAGGVLLASVPTSGTLGFNLRIIRRHPLTWVTANILMWLYPIVGKPELAREWFFSADIPRETLNKHFSKLQNESYRAALDMLFLNLPRPKKVHAPVAVIGAEADRVFSIPEIESTARAYSVDPKIFPNMAHNMMSEPHWEQVAEWIDGWASSVVEARRR